MSGKVNSMFLSRPTLRKRAQQARPGRLAPPNVVSRSLPRRAATALLAGAILALPPQALPQEFSPLPLIVTVVSGEGVTNSPHNNAAEALRVQVETGDHKPAGHALVQFQAPDNGPGGDFPDGRKMLEVTADDRGIAVANGFQPNQLAGPFDIKVTALQGGQSGFATIHQVNVAGRSGISHHPWWIAAGVLVVGAAAGGTVLALHHGGSSSTSISPGGVTVGAPH